MERRELRLLLLGVAGLMAGASGCSRSPAPKKASAPPGPPILLFAADGLEWQVALPMIRRGELPTLASLMSRGTCGWLQTIAPTSSPVIWTSVATGKLPNKHGITGFVYRLPDDPPEEVHLFTSADRITKAFWNILTDYGRTVSTLGWWMTFPVEPVRGVMVAQTNTPEQARTARGENIWKGGLIEGVKGQVYPPERQAEMLTVLAECDANLPGLIERIFGSFKYPQSALTRRLWEKCRWAFRADSTYFRIATKLIAAPDRPELLAVYMGGTDVLSHRFWRYKYPQRYKFRPSDEDIEDYAHVIGDYYAHVDECLGELIAVYGGEVTVIVVSDHGFVPIQTDVSFDPDVLPVNVNSGGHPLTIRPPGMIVMAGPCIRKTLLPRPLSELRKTDLSSLCSVVDVTPTILALMGIPIGEDMDGTVVVSAIDPGWLEKHPIERVGSHDTAEWLAARPKTELESPNKEKRLEQLRALGYIK